MPGNVIEKYWNRAKSRAEDEGHTEDWPYVMAIYKNMTKNKKTGFLTMMHEVAQIQKTAGLRSRLASTIKKVKAIYEKTEPLREEKHDPGKPASSWESWYKFKKLSGIDDLFPEQKPVKKTNVGKTIDSLIETVESLIKPVPKTVIVPEDYQK